MEPRLNMRPRLFAYDCQKTAVLRTRLVRKSDAPIAVAGTAVAKMWSSSDAKRLSSAHASTSRPHVAAAVIAALHRARDRLLLVLLLLTTMMLTSS